ncbi:phage tail sheath C-terminal domain-containing protein [Flavobacterium sp. SUN052]|uniref:phage tail sheath C-terminal domain-containing protein n=1 Tax=Flavobacterium sp. SUN052 TaxID=3002441 RepID=UPI00237E7D83|nr:phage tail sheath C-terminal domain-containing protein [Flavobacterium sp. SUN052]MEC4004874.1 phage tail sheath C-terminal domain-containing protein [Flavobacterium sp. SUN052]
MNVSSIKTPGVYINEIDAFPQSVAQVATAIPAFVGYTEKGSTEPTRIVSMLEYKQLFGGGPQPATISISLDADNTPTSATNAAESQYNLYNSLQLFYANGGGECYIVSVGTYSSAITGVKLIAGLDKLRSYDEPTLLLFPDAIALSATDLGLVQQQALLQCEDLMDRFVIMDVKQVSNPTNTESQNLDSSTLDFRNGIGINALKYGAAYYPNLVSSFNEYSFSYNDINSKMPANKKFADLYPDVADIGLFDKLLPIVKGYNDAWGLIGNQPKKEQFSAITSKALLVSSIKNSTDLLKIFADAETIIGSDNLKGFVKSDLISSRLKSLLASIIDFGVTYNVKASSALVLNDFNLGGFDINWDVPTTLPVFSASNQYAGRLTSGTGTSEATDNSKVLSQYNELHARIVAALNASVILVNKFQSIQEANLLPKLPLFSTISAKLNQSMNTIPPSGAVAGSYAQTDATRGVWKAPANLSLNGIIGLTDDVNDSEQENMNIHDSGKSINAIRKFTGKGFLVWGARTLDGNSNDWRYVNVRRLAIMIEESVKKACMHYVFEPNVALTWVNVKGMIENYLSTVWSDGGLAGAKPEQAFFVSVGLNQTMTAQDILEGRMIVKVGYAPSRPAEFIILEFKQMLQQS